MAAGFAPAPRRNAPCRAIPRFRDRVRSCPLLAFERRSWAQWPWVCLRPCPARRPRGGRAARARGTRGSLRRTLVGAAGASGSHPFLLRFSREGSAATARTRNLAYGEGLEARRPHRPAALTLVGARAETVAAPPGATPDPFSELTPICNRFEV